jgi:hypothetical protein
LVSLEFFLPQHCNPRVRKNHLCVILSRVGGCARARVESGQLLRSCWSGGVVCSINVLLRYQFPAPTGVAMGFTLRQVGVPCLRVRSNIFLIK